MFHVGYAIYSQRDDTFFVFLNKIFLLGVKDDLAAGIKSIHSGKTQISTGAISPLATIKREKILTKWKVPLHLSRKGQIYAAFDQSE